MDTMLFISYSWSDILLARKLYNSLKSSRFDIWIDYKMLDLSDPLELEIKNAISDSISIILIDTMKSKSSIWVQYELDWARYFGKPVAKFNSDVTTNIISELRNAQPSAEPDVKKLRFAPLFHAG